MPGSCALGFTTSFPGYKEWTEVQPSWPPCVEEKTLLPRTPDFLDITNAHPDFSFGVHLLPGLWGADASWQPCVLTHWVRGRMDGREGRTDRWVLALPVCSPCGFGEVTT